MFKLMLIAGAGGFVGTCARYAVGRLCSTICLGTFPLGTLAVNLLGCLIIGLLFGLIERYDALSQQQALLLVTGLCGGFTTFSTFALDLFNLGRSSAWPTATFYLILSIAGGVALVALGRTLTRL